MYSGYQKQLPRLPLHECDVEYQRLNRRTVQGAMEEAFYRLGPKNEVFIYGSSRLVIVVVYRYHFSISNAMIIPPRTDTGVHALSTSAIVDLEVAEDDERGDLKLGKRMEKSLVGFGKDGKRYFDPKLITAVVNRVFSQAELPIRSVLQHPCLAT